MVTPFNRGSPFGRWDYRPRYDVRAALALLVQPRRGSTAKPALMGLDTSAPSFVCRPASGRLSGAPASCDASGPPL